MTVLFLLWLYADPAAVMKPRSFSCDIVRLYAGHNGEAAAARFVKKYGWPRRCLVHLPPAAPDS